MRKTLGRIVALATAIVLLSGASVHATGVLPGSPTDPVVTESFVYSRMDALFEEILAIVGTGGGTGGGGIGGLHLTDAQLDIIVDAVFERMFPGGTGTGLHNMVFEPVQLFPGQRLIATGYGTEIVLRSGRAYAVVPGPNGLSDLTIAVDVLNNQVINREHHLVIPRPDGRGIRAQTEVWLLVRGSFQIIAW